MVEAGTMTRPILWIFAPAVGRGRRHRRMRRYLARRATRRPSGYVARTARPQRPCAYGRCLMSAPAPRSARRYASRLGAAAARPRAQVRPARTAPCAGRPGALCASCTRLGSGQPAFAVCPSLRPCTRAAPGRPPQASALAWRGLICARGRAASAPRLRAHTFSLRAGAGALLEALPYRRRGAAGLARGAHFAYGLPGCPCHSRAASGGRRRPGSGGRARPRRSNPCGEPAPPAAPPSRAHRRRARSRREPNLRAAPAPPRRGERSAPTRPRCLEAVSQPERPPLPNAPRGNACPARPAPAATTMRCRPSVPRRRQIPHSAIRRHRGRASSAPQARHNTFRSPLPVVAILAPAPLLQLFSRPPQPLPPSCTRACPLVHSSLPLPSHLPFLRTFMWTKAPLANALPRPRPGPSSLWIFFIWTMIPRSKQPLPQVIRTSFFWTRISCSAFAPCVKLSVLQARARGPRQRPASGRLVIHTSRMWTRVSASTPPFRHALFILIFWTRI